MRTRASTSWQRSNVPVINCTSIASEGRSRASSRWPSASRGPAAGEHVLYDGHGVEDAARPVEHGENRPDLGEGRPRQSAHHPDALETGQVLLRIEGLIRASPSAGAQQPTLLAMPSSDIRMTHTHLALIRPGPGVPVTDADMSPTLLCTSDIRPKKPPPTLPPALPAGPPRWRHETLNNDHDLRRPPRQRRLRNWACRRRGVPLRPHDRPCHRDPPDDGPARGRRCPYVQRGRGDRRGVPRRAQPGR